MTTPSEPAGPGPVLSALGITKAFGGVKALRGADLTIARPGEVHTLLGENGSGKSTLLGVLSGQLRPDAGELVLDGRRTGFFSSPADSLAHGIAMVSQEVSVAPSLTVTENILMGRLPGRHGRVDWAQAHTTARAALREVGLGDIPPTRAVRELSPDQRQLVEIARAISTDARVLILDEPTSSLMDDEVDTLLVTIRALADRGLSVVFVSHRLDEVFRISDRITVLRDGQTVASAATAEFTPQSLVSAMIGAEYRATEPPDPAAFATDGAVLALHGLTSSHAFRDISLAVRPGEIVGVAGLVGSGRSELLRAVFGSEPVTGGTMTLDGVAHRPRSEREAIARRVAYLPPERKTQGVVLAMSVADNLCVVTEHDRFRLARPGRRTRQTAYDTAVRSLRLASPSPGVPVATLSGGNQQKVALAKWLDAGVRLLLLDEPTRGVDVAAKAQIHQRLREAAEAGVGILVSSSDQPELIELCHRIVVLSRGRVIGELDRTQATEAALASLSGGQR